MPASLPGQARANTSIIDDRPWPIIGRSGAKSPGPPTAIARRPWAAAAAQIGRRRRRAHGPKGRDARPITPRASRSQRPISLSLVRALRCGRAGPPGPRPGPGPARQVRLGSAPAAGPRARLACPLNPRAIRSPRRLYRPSTQPRARPNCPLNHAGGGHGQTLPQVRDRGAGRSQISPCPRAPSTAGSRAFVRPSRLRQAGRRQEHRAARLAAPGRQLGGGALVSRCSDHNSRHARSARIACLLACRGRNQGGTRALRTWRRKLSGAIYPVSNKMIGFYPSRIIKSRQITTSHLF